MQRSCRLVWLVLQHANVHCSRRGGALVGDGSLDLGIGGGGQELRALRLDDAQELGAVVGQPSEIILAGGCTAQRVLKVSDTQHRVAGRDRKWIGRQRRDCLMASCT